MRSKQLLPLVIMTIVAVALLIYGLIYTIPSKKEVATQSDSLMSVDEKKSVDTSILTRPILQDSQSSRSFGQHPVPVPDSASRSNPFEGL